MKPNIPLVSSVLHTTDFSAASHRAFAHALAIALLRQTELTILHVTEQPRDDIDWAGFPEVRKTLERWNLLEPGSKRSAVFDELNVEVRKVAIKGRDAVRATTRFLNQQPHDLVVMATSGSRGAGEDWLHRSDAEGIARGSGTMTLFVPGNAGHGFVSLEDGDLNLKNVLIPVDPAINCTAATEFAHRAAGVMGDGDTVITLLHVGDRMPPVPRLPEGDGWSWQKKLQSGEPVDTILATMAELDTDLIIMATNGRDTLHQALAGSTTERVLRKATCPVLAVPDGKYWAAT
jgi:nucleotide-binding universal stress UspA family protein